MAQLVFFLTWQCLYYWHGCSVYFHWCIKQWGNNISTIRWLFLKLSQQLALALIPQSIPLSLHCSAISSFKAIIGEGRGNWGFYNTFSAVSLKDSIEDQLHSKLTWSSIQDSEYSFRDAAGVIYPQKKKGTVRHTHIGESGTKKESRTKGTER